MNLHVRSLISLLLVAASVFSSGCSIYVRTSSLPRVNQLRDLSPESTDRDGLLLALGTPTGHGVHRVGDGDRELWFYSSMSGKMNVFTASGPMDSMIAFASLNDGGQVEDLLSFTSSFDGVPLRPAKTIGVRRIADRITVGTTRADEVVAEFGEPTYRGRRYSRVHGVNHGLLFYDASKQKSGALRERWLIIGHDQGGIVRDLLWTSSFDEDIAEMGTIQAQQLRELTHLDADFPYTFSRTHAVSTSTKIDAGQVGALLRSASSNVEDFTKVLGAPTARGFKAFHGEEPLILAHWSFQEMAMRGQERSPPPRPVVYPDGSSLPSVTYNVFESAQTRLFVGHSPDGAVREVYWVEPGEPSKN